MNFDDTTPGRKSSASEATDSYAHTPTPHKYRREYERIAKGPTRMEVRSKILNAVRRTLRVSSYETFSMEEIAASAAITRRTLYNQFVNKDDLYRSCCEQLLKEVGGKVTEEIPERMTLEDGIQFFVECCMEVYSTDAARDLVLLIVKDGKTQPWLVQSYHREIHDRLVRSCENFVLKQSRRASLTSAAPRYVGEQLVDTVKALTIGPYIFGQDGKRMSSMKDRLGILASAYGSMLTKEKKIMIG